MYSYVLQANTLLPAMLQKGDPHTPMKEQFVFIIALFPIFYAKSGNCKDLLLFLTTTGWKAVFVLSDISPLVVCILFQSPITRCLRFPPTPHPPSVILRKFSLVFSDTCLSVGELIYIIASHNSYFHIPIIWDFYIPPSTFFF